ncbi:MAG: hypothetical protein HY554_04885, partial [Elusimicrobia bacterium]|nr:hypothetical protein [Elusimicrobiota bacterium]
MNWIWAALGLTLATTPGSAETAAPFQAEGLLEVIAVYRPAANVPPIRRWLSTAEGRIELLLPRGDTPRLRRSLVRVRARGMLRADGLHLASEDDLELLSSGLGPSHAPPHHAESAAVKDVRLALILVHYDEPAAPDSIAELESSLFSGPESVSAFYRHVSDGHVSISGQAFGPFSIRRPAGCDARVLLDAAVAAADAAVDFRSYDGVVVAYPHDPCFPWGGLGTLNRIIVPSDEGRLPLTVAWINTIESFLTVAAHEIGHNLELGHANAYECPSGLERKALCQTVEYGDPFDVMGMSSLLLSPNAPHREKAGWLRAPQLEEASRSGTFELSPLNRRDGAVRALKVPETWASDGTVSSWYYLEFRQPDSIDRPPVFPNNEHDRTAFTGVTVRIRQDLGGGDTQLIQPHPGIKMAWDSALIPGETFEDPKTGVAVTTLSTSTERAVVRVSVPELPSAWIEGLAEGQILAGAVDVAVRHKGPIVSARLEVDGKPAFVESWRDAGDGLRVLRWPTLGVPDGRHALRAVVADPGGRESRSAPVSVNVVNRDLIAPMAAILAPSSGTTVTGRLEVIFTASDDRPGA